MRIRSVAIMLTLVLAVGGCGGDDPTVSTMSEADINAMCNGLYDAVDTFDYLPKPITQEQMDRLAALNERIANECG